MADKDYSVDREALETLLDISSARVQQNVKIVTPDEIGQDFMLHISTNTDIRKFIPQLTLRGAPSENRDITRVCVGPSLLGCMIGYAQMSNDVQEKASNAKDEHNGYKGGWKIYALPFKAALKPNPKMVWDQRMSDEHWMVTYSEDTKEFRPVNAGRFFWKSLTLYTRSKTHVAGECVMYAEITMDGGIMLGANKRLAKGYWKIAGPVPENVATWKDDDAYEVTAISKQDYEQCKKLSADLLSYSDKVAVPAWAKW